jgi:hypothetical protein
MATRTNRQRLAIVQFVASAGLLDQLCAGRCLGDRRRRPK